MSEIAYFSDFIKQHRAELPSAESISSFANVVAGHIDTIASDYMRGDFAKWVDHLLEPSTRNND